MKLALARAMLMHADILLLDGEGSDASTAHHNFSAAIVSGLGVRFLFFLLCLYAW